MSRHKLLKHWLALALSLSSVALLSLSCQTQQTGDSARQLGADMRLLSRIGRATNRYRASLDLAGYAQSAVERALAERHWELNRDILKLEFLQAKLDLAEIAPKKGPTKGAEQDDMLGPQRENTLAEAEKTRAEIERIQQHLTAAEQNRRQAVSSRAIEQAEAELTRTRQALAISQKELALLEANLRIVEIQRKESGESPEKTESLAGKVVLLEKEALGKDAMVELPFPKASNTTASSGSGLIGSLRAWWNLYDKGQVLERAELRTKRMLDDIKQSHSENQKLRKKLREEHWNLNREMRALYGQAAELLKQPGQEEQTTRLISEADSKLNASMDYIRRRQKAGQRQVVFQQKLLLATEDAGRLASWSQVVSENRSRALTRLMQRVGSLLGMIFVVFLIAYFAKKIPGRIVKEEKSAYYFRKLISFIAWLIVILIMIFNAAGGIGSISAVIGLAGAGLAIALQDPIVSLVGWFLIIGKYGISVGDRIEINGVRGDVADVGMLRIAVMEVGNWLSGEQSTGRMVFFPNSFIFKGHFFNFSSNNSFVWDEVHILVTYESPWKKAREIILRVAEEASRDVVQRARESQQKMTQRFSVNLGNPEPYIFVSIADSGVDLVLRFISDVKLRRVLRDRICSEILEVFEREKDIQLAYPTQRQLTETRIINAAMPGEATHPGSVAGI